MRSQLLLLFFVSESQRVYTQTTDVNPAFVNIAPCSCDLTLNQLDNNCCCDEVDNASAYSGIFNCIPGTYGGDFTIQYDAMCSAVLDFTPDWFPLLCVQFLNSPSLGLFFYPSATSGSADANSYDRGISSLTVSNSLQAGDTVYAQYTGFHDNVLRFPQASGSGNCLRQSPIRYLYDVSSSCDVVVDSTLCTSASILDANYYTGMESVANQNPNVSYMCAGSDDSIYVKRNTGIGGTETTTAATTCSYSAPQVSAGVCQNAVGGVSYAFTWDAGNITQFDIVVTLVDITLTNTTASSSATVPDYVLAQQFTASFVTDSTNATALSGFPGYEFGLPVISSNASSATAVDRTVQLLAWSSGTSAECGATETPKFGFDQMSGCVVTTSSDCATTRAAVESLQLQLLQADRVARFGNPGDTNSDGDWVDVVSSVTNETYSDTTPGRCEGIPSTAVLEFLWAKTGETNGTDIREIVSAYVSFERETWVLRCSSGSTCDSRNIYSVVRFTEIPAQQSTPLTSYEINRDDTCTKDATCWPELLLPLRPEFYYLYNETVAFELRSYNYAWAIFVTFFSVAAALIPAHWSTVGKYLQQVLPI